MKTRPTRVFINGFGRIGRLVVRRILEMPRKNAGIEIVGVNDLVDERMLAYLLEYDTTHGKFGMPVEVGAGRMAVLARGWPVYKERDLTKLPLEGVDVVVESTGVFTKREDLEKHLHAGAGNVILTAPAKSAEDVDATVVLGVNENSLDPARHLLISNASCTTNCLAPVVKVLHDGFGVEYGLMNTVHAYTNDQRLLDLPHRDFRRARAAAENIVPSSTGAAKAIGLVIPELAGRLNGRALRVPVKDGSVVDLVAYLSRNVTKKDVERAFRDAARDERYRAYHTLRITYGSEHPVSNDIIGEDWSSIVDMEYLDVMGPRMVQVMAWYDNEWAYSCRVVDLIRYIARHRNQ